MTRLIRLFVFSFLLVLPDSVLKAQAHAEDFRVVDGRILGPWWQGGALGVVYFTGSHAQKMKAFENVGQTVARQMNQPYQEIHKEHLLPSEDHPRGILLYPDGTARVRLFIMPGGNSFFTMSALAGISEPTGKAAAAERQKFVEARKNPQAAFQTGMNYVGACGGFFTATSGYDVPRALFHGWGLWPGKVANIGPAQRRPFPDVVFDPAQAEHPLLQNVKDGVLRNMYYNGGPIGVPSDIPDTEYFGKYRGGALTELADDWFCVAYLPADNLRYGRAVIATGHPEVHHPEFLLSMAQYAVARDYEVPRNPIQPGEPIQGISGDNQIQYYAIDVEAGQRLTVLLADPEDNCDLYLRAQLPPTLDRNDFRSVSPQTAEERITVPATLATTYFIAVHGNHSRLKGAKYTLTVQVE